MSKHVENNSRTNFEWIATIKVLVVRSNTGHYHIHFTYIYNKVWFCYLYSVSDCILADLDCLDVRKRTKRSVDGIYTVNINGIGMINVFCDMTTDGGGWTVRLNLRFVFSTIILVTILVATFRCQTSVTAVFITEQFKDIKKAYLKICLYCLNYFTTHSKPFLMLIDCVLTMHDTIRSNS